MQATVDVDLTPGTILPYSIQIEQPQVLLRGVVRRLDDRWLLSIFLVNHQQEPDERRDEAWLFQPELELGDTEDRSIFVCRILAAAPSAEQDEELRAMDMLYRDRCEFAVGHGVGVHAEADLADPRRARRVATRIIPAHEVPLQDSRHSKDDPNLEPLVLDMRELAEAPRAELGLKLRALPDAYAAWIRRQRARLGDRDARLDEFTAEAHRDLAACEAALGRIRDGLALLSADEKAAEAFRFANRAMYLQRLRTGSASASAAVTMSPSRPSTAPSTAPGASSSSPSSCSTSTAPRAFTTPIAATPSAPSPTCCGSRPAAARRRPIWA
jgi:hypothetical protein